MLKQNQSFLQTQTLTPQQIQYIQLLQLNTVEFEKRLEEEMLENPALEMEDEAYQETPEVDYKDQKIEDSKTEVESSSTDSQEDFSQELDDYGDEEPYETNSVEELSLSDDAPREDMEEFMNTDEYDPTEVGLPKDPNEDNKDIPYAGNNSTYDLLMEQLNALDIDSHQQFLGEFLIGMLEDGGYLRRPLKNLVNDITFQYNISTSVAELEKMLKIIQSFEPAGIGARDLQECLVLQLKRKDQSNIHVKYAIKIVENYLEELSKKHFEKMSKALKISSEELKEVISIITHLDPKPGDIEISQRVQYIIPDFTVSQHDGNTIISLNSKNAPELRLSDAYLETFRKKTDEAHNKIEKKETKFYKDKLENAKWFVEAVKQRQNTLMDTMKCIVAYQKDYFENGDYENLKPMILKDIADKIGMDISTISRVVNSKYVQTDFGIKPLKEFFSEGIATDSGEEVSNREVKFALKAMIEAEDKSKPLTDEKLTDMLNEKGYDVARRTVAKYREQLGLQVARMRREI